MKLFSLITMAYAGRPGQEIYQPGDPVGFLNMVAAATTADMNEIHGADSYNEKWRVRLRTKRDNIIAAMIDDYENTRLPAGCDPNAAWDNTAFEKEDEEFDIKDKDLPEDCKPAAEPIQNCGRAAARWSRMWNFYCAQDVAKRRHKRLLKRIRFLRQHAYAWVPQCSIEVPEGNAGIKDWVWKW